MVIFGLSWNGGGTDGPGGSGNDNVKQMFQGTCADGILTGKIKPKNKRPQNKRLVYSVGDMETQKNCQGLKAIKQTPV